MAGLLFQSDIIHLLRRHAIFSLPLHYHYRRIIFVQTCSTAETIWKNNCYFFDVFRHSLSFLFRTTANFFFMLLGFHLINLFLLLCTLIFSIPIKYTTNTLYPATTAFIILQLNRIFYLKITIIYLYGLILILIKIFFFV